MLTLGSVAASLRQVRHYCRHFGIVDGLDLYARGDSPGRLVRLNVKGYPSPVYIRSGTSDVPVVDQVFLQGAHRNLGLDREPVTIVDLGANIGLVSVQFAKIYSRATIIAVEPDPENFTLLIRNTKPYKGIIPVQAAVWSSNEALELSGEGSDYWARNVRAANPSNGSATTVQGVTVQDLVRKFHLDTIDLLKVDIEGAEKEIFREGCEEWLGLTRAILIELHDRLVPECARTFYQAIVRRPFSLAQIGECAFVRFESNDQ